MTLSVRDDIDNFITLNYELCALVHTLIQSEQNRFELHLDMQIRMIEACLQKKIKVFLYRRNISAYETISGQHRYT